MKKFFISAFFIVILSMPFDAHAQGMLQIKGSDTEVNLVQRLAEVYMEENTGNQIAVTGGGSGTGIAALINKKCDVANSSRLMSPSEISQAAEQGVIVQRVVFAMDGLSIVTNGDNPVVQLTMDEIGKIFRGEVTNWKEVGGSDVPITMYGRQSNSGTYVFFREFVLKGDYSQKMNHMNGNAQIVEAIKNDVSGVGYVGVGYVRDVSVINVVKVAARAGADYSSPLNPDEVKSGKYPISRPLNQYFSGTPAGVLKSFLDFELSERGQQIIEEQGFFPIPEEYKEFNRRVGL